MVGPFKVIQVIAVLHPVRPLSWNENSRAECSDDAKWTFELDSVCQSLPLTLSIF